MRNVTVIPASVNRFTDIPLAVPQKRKVAAYARVSTDEEEQQTSYSAQCDYYERYIKSRSDWEFVGLYSDEGVTGTSTKKRIGFTKMVEDALAGKIDLILAKSLSRFSRNTVDSLTTIRKLKASGVEVWFEKENIHTFDPKVEVILTILSSLSQEESRSISENVNWGVRKKMADGKFTLAYSTFYGYDRGEGESLVINEEQAKTVRLIFKLFLEGLSCKAIAKELTKRGIPTATGKSIWRGETIHRMLQNEKLAGNARLQKTYTPDFLTKKRAKNIGQLPSYFVENSHPAIIDTALFEMAQTELARRSKGNTKYSGVSIFSNRIKCGDCGSWFGSKVWHSNDAYRRVIYRCNKKYGEEKCHTPHVTEDEIKAAFVTAFNRLIDCRDEIIDNIRIIQKTVCGTADLEIEKTRLQEELTVLVRMTQDCVTENARVAQDQEEYRRRYDGLVQRYEAVKCQYDKVESEIADKTARREKLAGFIRLLKGQEASLSEFDEHLWGCLVDFVTVSRDKEMTVTFRDGTEIKV